MKSEIARSSLDKKLKTSLLQDLQRPHKGWIRAVREALGMSSVQLAERLGVSKPRITALEKSEIEDTITLATLRRAAAAMKCKLVYAFVPEKSFQEIVEERAREVATRMSGQVDHTMALEAQNLDKKTLKDETEKLTQELIRDNLKQLWRDIK